MTGDLVRTIKDALAAAGYDVLEGEGVNVEGRLRNGSSVRLGLVTPSGFPYELPGFRLDQSMLADYGKLPHVGPTGQICAFDRETNIPNPLKPEAQVVEILGKTLEILSDGIEGTNDGDYLDEFLAYWGYGQEPMLRLYSLAENMGDQPRTLSVYSSSKDEKRLFICKSREEALSLAERLKDPQAEQSVLRCLYLPLSEPVAYPFPITHREWFELVRKDSQCLSAYKGFLRSSDRQKAVIVFSCPYPDGRRVFAAYGHDGLPSMKGFRKGRVPLEVALSAIGNNKVPRYEYVDTSQSRLYLRGGVGIMAKMKACIIGCGSLGSHLADTLAICGISEFTLVDNQTLAVENIARHLCGFEDVGKPKADAVMERLIANNPNIRCGAHNENANVLLENPPADVASSDYIFVTVGSYPLERHIVEKALELRWDARVVLLWVEPFAAAAHALVLNTPQDVQAKMFDTMGRFIDSVVVNGDELFKREAGCQSTYVPYSGLDVRSFLIDFVRSLISGKLNGHNYHYAWHGALSQAHLHGVEVDQRFANKADYSAEIQRID